MSGFSLKGGWHPEGKGGKKESWRGDFKGINQIANKFGKGRDPDADKQREEHVSQPLSALKDPSAFGPPPKHVNYHGAAAVPNATTPDTRGLGAPLPRETVQHQQQAQYHAAAEEQEEEKPPPGPFQRDTTGLSTANLPKPPVRRVDTGSPAPPPPPRSARGSPAPPPRSAVAAPPKAAPRLPPRLPPRQNSRPDLHTPDPPPSYNEAATIPAPDEGALNRLGRAGVSVPGFDIGGSTSSPTRSTNPTPPGAPQAAQVNELQSRFAKMSFPSSSSNSASPTGNAPDQGTTWEQKQAAANTASKFHKDPSSVSVSDARSAASTANNFRERHGETVKSGFQTAKSMGQKYGQQAKDMNTKYGITDRAKGYATSAANYNRSTPAPPSASPAAAAAKKPPPPPPPKKRELGSVPTSSDSPPPPPVPLSSKPR